MSWLDKLLPPRIKRENGSSSKKNIPEGLWRKCAACESVLYASDLEQNLFVCPKCNYHHRVNARTRINLLLDEDNRKEIGTDVLPTDPLKFKDLRKYPERLQTAKQDTGEDDALVVMEGTILGHPVVIAVFEFDFMGGSMGSVVGERFVRGVKACVENNAAMVCFTATGGARMQEGLFSLMQMAKTTASLHLLKDARLPFISVLTDPTMGGVSASFAMVADIVLAEPNALIGFAGPRVIEQTVRETLPEGFQRAEFLLEKGQIDSIIDRREMRSKLAAFIALLQNFPIEI